MDSSSRIMVLSAFGGADAAMQSFARAWQAALEQLGLQSWHSSKHFRRSDPGVRSQIPVQLINVIGQVLTQEINCISMAVDTQSARDLGNQFPGEVPSDNEMLVEWCFSAMGVAKSDFGRPGSVRVFFDKNEPFIKHLKGPWQKGRTTLRQSRETGWPLQIGEIEPADCAAHPGMQAADLLSWVIRNCYEYGDKLKDPKVPVIMFAFLGAKLRGGLLDEAAIRDFYVDGKSVTLAHRYSFI